MAKNKKGEDKFVAEVTLVATENNKHHKKGAEFVTNSKIAKVLIDKGYATEK